MAPAGVELQAGLIVLCLGLWLGESVPPFGPTLLLLAAAPIVLTDRGATMAVKTVLGWAADPVLALFFGGLAAGGSRPEASPRRARGSLARPEEPRVAAHARRPPHGRYRAPLDVDEQRGRSGDDDRRRATGAGEARR